MISVIPGQILRRRRDASNESRNLAVLVNRVLNLKRPAGARDRIACGVTQAHTLGEMAVS
eukprot:COSAG06_NODE_43745_length_369_cov_0.874074_1_plen_59_part_10